MEQNKISNRVIEDNESSFLNSFERLELPLYGVRCPEINFNKKELIKNGVKEYKDNLDLLKQLCNTGYKQKILPLKEKGIDLDVYKSRVKEEVETLNKLGFVDYILIVWDVFNFCSSQGIPVGLGRGSAGSSLVLYLLGVTGIDPVKYGLFFQRFVSEVRAKKQVIDGITYLDGSMIADIDSDICYYRRKEVVEYLDKKYPNRTSKMLTVSTLSGKALIKDCGKIVGEKDETEMNKVTSLFPTKFGKVEELEIVYDEVEEFQNWANENKLVYNIAQKLKNLIRNKGVHASGTLVGYDELTKTTPIELSADKERVSGFTMDWATKVNIKLDLLGLKSVSVIDEVARLTGINYHEIDLEDYERIYAHLQDLKNPKGIFQIEADTNYKVCKEVKPKNLDQLSAVVALARPGALAFVEQYAEYAQTGVFPEVFPQTDEILKETGGAILYQESLMAIGNQVFGLTLDEAEQVRKCTSKKKPEEMAKWERVIRENTKKLDLPEGIDDFYWSALSDSANYSFCRGHAIPYAAMAALTVFYKFNYPQQFFLALLRMAKHESDSLEEIAKISIDMKEFGIELLPPDLNKSGDDFEIEGGNIRYGLSAIKGISEKIIKKFSEFRGTYSSKIDLFISAKQAGISIGVVSALIQAGALESLRMAKSRSFCVLEAQVWNMLKDREKVEVKEMIDSGEFKDVISCVKYLNTERKDDKGKPFIKDSRYKTIKRDYDGYKTIYMMNSRNEELANFFYEKELLGRSYSESLAGIYQKKARNIKTIKEFQGLNEMEKGMIVGVVIDKVARTSAKGNPYIKYTVQDESGTIDCFIFSSAHRDKIEMVKGDNGGKLPEKKDIVLVQGARKDETAMYVDKLGIQSAKIFMKLKELKDQENAKS